jgi:hypothetical protein
LTLAHLESLKNALTGNAGINGMVDGKIYKFKSIEKSEPDLRSAAHKSLISCEVGDWAGGKLSSDPIFIVDIRSRQMAALSTVQRSSRPLRSCWMTDSERGPVLLLSRRSEEK